MPIYEFNCPACQTRFEKLIQRMGDDSRPPCPQCGSGDTARALSVFAVSADATRERPPAVGMCGCGKVPGSCGMN